MKLLCRGGVLNRFSVDLSTQALGSSILHINMNLDVQDVHQTLCTITKSCNINLLSIFESF